MLVFELAKKCIFRNYERNIKKCYYRKKQFIPYFSNTKLEYGVKELILAFIWILLLIKILCFLKI